MMTEERVSAEVLRNGAEYHPAEWVRNACEELLAQREQAGEQVVKISDIRAMLEAGKVAGKDCVYFFKPSEIEAWLRTAAPPAQPGAVSVPASPRDATNKMTEAALDVARFEYGHGVTKSSVAAIWKAMWDAAPRQPEAQHFVERKLSIAQIERLINEGIEFELMPNGNAKIAIRPEAQPTEDEAVRKDAERYRWLRQLPGNESMLKALEDACAEPDSPEAFDAAIDAALSKGAK